MKNGLLLSTIFGLVSLAVMEKEAGARNVTLWENHFTRSRSGGVTPYGVYYGCGTSAQCEVEVSRIMQQQIDYSTGECTRAGGTLTTDWGPVTSTTSVDGKQWTFSVTAHVRCDKEVI